MASSHCEGHRLKALTEQEKECLRKDKDCLSDFKRTKLENDAKKNWDLFYKRNSTHFFKDRHWISRECREINQLIKESQVDGSRRVLLEVGCGVGNALFPLIEENERSNMFIYGCDFSSNAIQFLKSHSLYNEDICKAFVCDITQEDSLISSNGIAPFTVDIVLLIFVLSAISPDKMNAVLFNIAKVLKPGGLVFFRDYGLYDHAMLRFSKGHKISENFYVRQDGTRAYYFSEDEVAHLFSTNGFSVIENSYIERETVNHKEGITVKRIFIQGKFKTTNHKEDK